MQKITNILSPIATTLSLTFIRSQNLSEANIDMHYDTAAKDLMIYNGEGKIVTNFNSGPLGEDQVDVEVYFLRLKTSADMDGAALELQYEAVRTIANKAYFDIQQTSSVYRYPTAFELEPVEVGTDMYIGYMMKLVITVENDGC